MKLFAIGLLCCFFLLVQGEENPYYDQAFEWREKQELDSAFQYFYLAKERFLENNDSFGAGKCMVNLALIMIYRNDFYNAQEISLDAIKHFDPTDSAHYHYIASNFNHIGDASLQLKDYENALLYFEQAIINASDSAEKRIYLNNKAKTFQEMGRYEDALVLYDQILEEEVNSPLAYARTLTNRAVTQSKVGGFNRDVRQDLLKALAIRQQNNDFRGLNSSYYRLSEYYQQINLDSAYYYATKMYEVAQQLQSPEDRVYALEKLIQSCSTAEIHAYFNEYQALQDSILQVRETSKNQFAFIRFEVEKNKAEALRLQQENDRKSFELWMHRMIIISGIVLVIAIACLAFYWLRRRRQRLQLEAENRIQTHKLHTSKKIHDVVANGLYRVMSEVEHYPELDRDDLLDKLETMYEKSRDISYEVERVVGEPARFHEELKAMVGSFITPDIKIVLVGSDDQLWQSVPAVIQQEIRFVLQELLVNMKKHSGANTVILRFIKSENELRVDYKDDGQGCRNLFSRKRIAKCGKPYC